MTPNKLSNNATFNVFYSMNRFRRFSQLCALPSGKLGIASNVACPQLRSAIFGNVQLLQLHHVASQILRWK